MNGEDGYFELFKKWYDEYYSEWFQPLINNYCPGMCAPPKLSNYSPKLLREEENCRLVRRTFLVLLWPLDGRARYWQELPKSTGLSFRLSTEQMRAIYCCGEHSLSPYAPIILRTRHSPFTLFQNRCIPLRPIFFNWIVYNG